MAGDWIKWVKGLSRRAEVLEMARALKTDRRIVACACMELWEWADTETQDGHIKGATSAFIDGLVALPGFASAIEAVGWLRSTEQGITLTRWDRHNGASAKKRAQDVERQQRHRANKSVTDSSRHDRDKKRDSCVTREEKRREEEIGPVQSTPLAHNSSLVSYGGRSARWGDLGWAGVKTIRDALVDLGVWPVVVQDVLDWEVPTDLETIRRVAEWVASDKGVRDPVAVFVHRLYRDYGPGLDALPRDQANTDWTRKRSQILSQLRRVRERSGP